MDSDVPPILDVQSRAVMLRRIPHWHFDFQSGSIHAKAFANDNSTNCHSVNWEEHTSVKETLVGHPGFGVATILAQDYIAEKQTIEHTPKLHNYGHCDAVGKKSAGVKKCLRKKAKLRVRPSSV